MSDDRSLSGEEILSLRQDLKARYGSLYEKILGIITKHDPIGIADIPDEYEPEVDTILPRIREAHSKSEVRRIVHEEFANWFSPKVAGPEGRFDSIAAEIWAVLQGAPPSG